MDISRKPHCVAWRHMLESLVALDTFILVLHCYLLCAVTVRRRYYRAILSLQWTSFITIMTPTNFSWRTISLLPSTNPESYNKIGPAIQESIAKIGTGFAPPICSYVPHGSAVDKKKNSSKTMFGQPVPRWCLGDDVPSSSSSQKSLQWEEGSH